MISSEPNVDKKLQRDERLRLWARCLAFAVIFALAIGIGQFSLSPDGHFQIGPGVPSHDPSKYRWWWQDGGLFSLPLLIEEGVFIGALLWLPVLVVIAIVVAGVLSLIPHFAVPARRVSSSQPLLLLLSALVLGWFVGVALTINSGVFPGICC